MSADPELVGQVATILRNRALASDRHDPNAADTTACLVVEAVQDWLTAAGKLRRSLYAGEGEARCGEPYPEGGPPCQLRPGHDTHARPASGGFDAWKRETDA